MKRLTFILPILIPVLLLAACESEREAEAVTSESGGRAEGEVLGGTISDDMIALEQLRSQAPLAPREGAAPVAGRSGESVAEESAPEPADPPEE